MLKARSQNKEIIGKKTKKINKHSDSALLLTLCALQITILLLLL